MRVFHSVPDHNAARWVEAVLTKEELEHLLLVQILRIAGIACEDFKKEWERSFPFLDFHRYACGLFDTIIAKCPTQRLVAKRSTNLDSTVFCQPSYRSFPGKAVPAAELRFSCLGSSQRQNCGDWRSNHFRQIQWRRREVAHLECRSMRTLSPERNRRACRQDRKSALQEDWMSTWTWSWFSSPGQHVRCEFFRGQERIHSSRLGV